MKEESGEVAFALPGKLQFKAGEVFEVGEPLVVIPIDGIDQGDSDE